MTVISSVDRRERRRQRRQDELRRWVIRAVVLLVVFALGIALGQAMHDNPKVGGSVTLERTLRVPTTGVAGQTVTP